MFVGTLKIRRRLRTLQRLTELAALTAIILRHSPEGRIAVFYRMARERFHDELQPYVQQKQKVLNAELVSLEKTLKATTGVDDPERLKRFLYDAGGNGT